MIQRAAAVTDCRRMGDRAADVLLAATSCVGKIVSQCKTGGHR
jgi:hypothetical protein